MARRKDPVHLNYNQKLFIEIYYIVISGNINN